MKKTLLLIATVAAAMTASAQTQYTFMDVKNGDGTDKFDGSDQPAGTVLVESADATMTLFLDEPVKVFTPSRDPYSHAGVGTDALVKISAGVTGNNNPNGQTFTSLPTSGMVYKISTKKSGVFTVFTKMNTNKNYWVFEGEQSFAAYRLGVCNLSKSDKTIEYTLPVDAYDALDLTSPEIGKYFNTDDAGTITGPKVPWAVAEPEGSDMGEGSGFIQFLSFASEEYPSEFYVFAQGSKMATNGFVFTPMAEPSFSTAVLPSVTFGGVEKTNADTGEVTPAPEPITFAGATYPVSGGAGIDNITTDVKAAELDWNAPVYNVMGQKVSKNFKGIAIQNGAKFVVK